MSWHARPPDAVLEDVDSDRSGLSAEEASRRLSRDGPNELVTGEGRSVLSLFADQFASPLILVLVAAAALSFAVGHAVDAVLIAVIVLANGAFGFVQEYRAEQSLEALRDMATPQVSVRRGGERATVPATEVVPGDVVLVSQGDVVPADARILEAGTLEVDEAPLTGESLPVSKSADALAGETPLAERSNMLYKGTSVERGRGEAVVVATGMETEMGAIATDLIEARTPDTPLQRDLATLGYRLGAAVLVLAAIVVPLLAIRGTPLLQAALTAISLAVAAIPEGLPAIVTLTLGLGVRQMADERALVRSLPAVEALGAIDVVCTDKTGTLTEGEMRVQTVWVHDEELAPGDEDERLDRLLEIGAVCNDADSDGESGDPTERALVRGAREHGLEVSALRERHPRRDERPFSADRKRMATVHDDAVYVKGAPQVLLERSTRLLTADGVVDLDGETREQIAATTDEFAGRALRVLAFAYREPPEEDAGEVESDLIFVGLGGLLDPPRAEVREAIADTRRAGIDVKMITGDNRATAAAIGEEVGIEGPVVTGDELEDLDGADLAERVEAVDVFARIVPRQKVAILRALQDRGHRVAMTGDGVNDAPALKNADVGIAMGVRGTDVARQASDIVLLDDNYATIRAAVRRGRTIFDNIWKFVAYLLSANVAEVLLVFVASLLGYLVLPAVQLLWINLLTDGLPALALGTDPAADDVMERPPRRREGVVDREMLTLIGGLGLVTTVAMLALTLYTIGGAPSATPYVVTMVFTGFVVFELAKLYVVRWTRGTALASNRWLAVAVAVSLLLQLGVLYTPLSGYFGTVPLALLDWAVLLGLLTAGLPLFVLVGAVTRRLAGERSPPERAGATAPDAGAGDADPDADPDPGAGADATEGDGRPDSGSDAGDERE